MRQLSFARRVLVVAIVALVGFCFFTLADSMEKGHLLAWPSNPYFAIRLTAVTIIATAMVALEFRRESPNAFASFTDGMLIAVIIIVVGNLSADDAQKVRLATRTAA